MKFTNNVNFSPRCKFTSIMKSYIGMPSKKEKKEKKRKKTEMWDIVPKGGRGSKPDPKFFIMFKWDI